MFKLCIPVNVSVLRVEDRVFPIEFEHLVGFSKNCVWSNLVAIIAAQLGRSAEKFCVKLYIFKWIICLNTCLFYLFPLLPIGDNNN